MIWPITEKRIVDHWDAQPEAVNKIIDDTRRLLCDPDFNGYPDTDEVHEVLIYLANENRALRIQLGLA